MINQERVVKKEWLNGHCKDTKLDKVRSEISDKIVKNIEKDMEKEIREMASSKCLQAEVFKIRKNIAKTINIDFPLKD